MAICFLGTPAGAQEPPPEDTLAVDTVAAPDTDTIIHHLQPFPQHVSPGWTAGVWVWDREDLLSGTALTLADLLNQLPGFTVARAGLFALPEAASALGQVGGNIEILLDGMVLDPLQSSALDISRIELNQLRSVRVRRGMQRTRIELETLGPVDPRPFSHIEAGTGDQGSDILRGLFIAPQLLGGSLALGVERLGTDGLLRREPANTFATWLKWSRVMGDYGMAFEMRNSTVQRRGEAPARGEANRTDMVARIRGEPVPGLTAEVLLGRSEEEKKLPLDSLRESSTQMAARTTYQGRHGWVGGALRRRSHEALPALEGEVSAGVRLPGVSLVGEYVEADWHSDVTASSLELRAEAAPVLGVRPVAEWSTGRRGVPFLDDADDEPFLSRRSAQRLGVEYAGNGIRLGVAGLRVRTDQVADFGLELGAMPERYPGGLVRGLELAAEVPLGWEPLSMQASFTGWLPGDSRWIYLPATRLRAAITYHHLPLPSGNLEFNSRLELQHRGVMDVATAMGPANVPGSMGLDFHLQVRVIDVRAFIRWENITHRLDDQDYPGRTFPGQRIFWGIKWHFWN